MESKLLSLCHTPESSRMTLAAHHTAEPAGELKVALNVEIKEQAFILGIVSDLGTCSAWVYCE